MHLLTLACDNPDCTSRREFPEALTIRYGTVEYGEQIVDEQNYRAAQEGWRVNTILERHYCCDECREACETETPQRVTAGAL